MVKQLFWVLIFVFPTYLYLRNGWYQVSNFTKLFTSFIIFISDFDFKYIYLSNFPYFSLNILLPVCLLFESFYDFEWKMICSIEGVVGDNTSTRRHKWNLNTYSVSAHEDGNEILILTLLYHYFASSFNLSSSYISWVGAVSWVGRVFAIQIKLSSNSTLFASSRWLLICQVWD